MTPEQRLDRVERILTLFVNAGRRARTQSREQDERISIIIKTHQETEEIMKGLALSQARFNQEMAKLDESQRLAEQAHRREMAKLEESQRIAEQTLRHEMAELAKSQKLTDEALRAYLKSQRKGQNGDSSN